MRVTTVCGETRAYPPASILCSLQRDADALSESCPLGPVDSPLVKWQPNAYTLSAFGTHGAFEGPLRAGCSRSPGRVFLPRARTNNRHYPAGAGGERRLELLKPPKPARAKQRFPCRVEGTGKSQAVLRRQEREDARRNCIACRPEQTGAVNEARMNLKSGRRKVSN